MAMEVQPTKLQKLHRFVFGEKTETMSLQKAGYFLTQLMATPPKTNIAPKNGGFQ